MKANSSSMELDSKSNASFNSVYTTNNPRFETLSANSNSTSTTTIGFGAYSIYMSSINERIGSFTTTSSQESYRSINSNFQNKIKSR